MSFVFAEAFWITCSNGLQMPMEIAIGYPDKPTISLFTIAPLPLDYWMTCGDMVNTKSRFYNKDRFYNFDCGTLDREIDYYEYPLNADLWLWQLKQYISSDVTIYARGPSQYSFFKDVCRYPNVKRIGLTISDQPVIKDFHTHYRSKLLKYPCPGVEVATILHYREHIRVMKSE